MTRERSECQVPILPPISYSMSYEPPAKIDELKWGTYRFVAGNWIWRDNDADR